MPYVGFYPGESRDDVKARAFHAAFPEGEVGPEEILRSGLIAVEVSDRIPHLLKMLDPEIKAEIELMLESVLEAGYMAGRARVAEKSGEMDGRFRLNQRSRIHFASGFLA